MNTEELKKALAEKLKEYEARTCRFKDPSEQKKYMANLLNQITTIFCDIARCEWHGVEDLEEAKEKDKYKLGCTVFTESCKNNANKGISFVYGWGENKKCEYFIDNYGGENYEFEIIGLPTDLGRVMHTMPATVVLKVTNHGDMHIERWIEGEWELCRPRKWDFKHPYEKQTTEVKIALAKLLL